MDISRHDANLAFSCLDDSRAVGSDEAGCALLVQVPFHLNEVGRSIRFLRLSEKVRKASYLDHVVLWNSFCDCDN